MAELRFPDIAGAVFSGYDFGNRMRMQRNAEQKQNRLSELAGQAYSTPRDQQASLLSQMATVSPEAAQQQQQAFQSDEDRRNKTMANMARLLVAAPQQARAGLYRQMMPTLQQFGLDGLPTDYNEQTASTIDQAANAIAQAYGGYSDTNELKTFNAMSQGLAPEQLAEARQIALGLKPRAVTGATKFGEFTDSMGRTRPQRNSPSTGSVEIYYDETGQWVPLGGDRQGSQPPVASNGANYGPAGGFSADQVAGIESELGRKLTQDDYRQIAAGTWQAQAPARVPGLGVSRTPEEQAALTAQATEAAKLPFEAQRMSMETNAAIQRATGQKQAEAQVDRQTSQIDRDATYKLYETTVNGLSTALKDAATGYIPGRLPAVTSDAQIAEGAVAAMAPVLKQIFRVSGEGTFTDKDQELLLSMLPTRKDNPRAAEAKIKNIDQIVRSKLRQPASAPSAPRRLKYNPATGKIE